MISSLVETVGWGTPSMPGGGNKAIGVLGEAIKVEGDPVATITAGEAVREAGFVFFPSHSIRSENNQIRLDLSATYPAPWVCFNISTLYFNILQIWKGGCLLQQEWVGIPVPVHSRESQLRIPIPGSRECIFSIPSLRVNIIQWWIFFRGEYFWGVNIFQGWIYFRGEYFHGWFFVSGD